MPRQRRWEPNTRLVYERERRGWSQEDAAREAEQVAGRLGRPDLVFTGAQFGRWERGESRPRPPLFAPCRPPTAPAPASIPATAK